MKMNARTKFTSLAVFIYSAFFMSVLRSMMVNVQAHNPGNVPVRNESLQRKIKALHSNTSAAQVRKIKHVDSKIGVTLPETLCNLTATFPCSCSVSLDGKVTVTCAHKNLTSVPPNIPEKVTELILSYNKIRTILASVFAKFSSLQTLDLSYNGISHLGSGSFNGLHQLKTLLLDGNPLKMSNKTFAEDVFDRLDNLLSLNLKSNFSVEEPEIQYPDVALGKLSSLETLLISGLSNKTFGAGFRNMTSLQTLDLSWTPSFRFISRNTFVNFNNLTLKNLLLNHCDLRWIHKDAFTHLPNIDTIDYSYNKNLEIKGVGMSFYGLQNSTIRKIVMRRVHQPPFFSVVTKEDIQYLKNTNLEELHVDNNTIGQVEDGVLLLLPLSIQIIRISWNNIQSNNRQVLRLLRFRNGTEIDASYQEVFQARVKLSSISTLSRYDRFNNTSSPVDPKNSQAVRKNAEIRFVLPPNLWMVNCSNTYKLRYTIPYLEFTNSSLTHVYLAYNLLDKWIGPVKGLDSVRYLDLTGNSCYKVSERFFAYGINLETLLIGENRFGKDFSDNTFYNLTKLIRLDMNDNQLESVGPNLFARLTSLTYLNLSKNYLSNWTGNISGLVKLTDLDLSDNKLKTLPRSLCRDLDTIQQFSNIQIDIQGNQLQCICDTEYFIEWLTQTKVYIRNLNSTSCTLANGTVLSLTDSTSILNHLQGHCRSYTVLIGGLCACLALFLIVALVALVRRHHWKLRYLWYMATNWRKRTGYQRLDTAEENPFGYDAFVSYEDSDRTFIREQVIPRLERDAGLKLCIDKRDFIAGLYVTDNILHAIQNSRKTVIFLSQKFLKSKWCVYEMNMARMEGIHSGRDVLVMVLTEKIPTSQLSAEIVDVIHNQTYIEMTNNVYGEALFWERLVSAIQAE
ncbi:toll-like receptor 4 [Liolophura sinensis]|uniref:toll-like receptor 4 n=1 Tax=Liolophura sinensis TaxID=3198878 RepID=UPI003158F8E3